VPAYYPDEPACKVKSIRRERTTYENAALSPVSDVTAVPQQDAKGIYQVYTTTSGSPDLKCISCTVTPGGPRVDRHKPMISWHPSGHWLLVGIEEATHDNMWMPNSWKRGLLDRK